MIIFDSDEEFVNGFKRMSEQEKLALVQDLKQLAGINRGPLLFYGPCERVRLDFMRLWNSTSVDVFGDSSNLPRPSLAKQ